MQACKCNKRRSVILRTACAISLAATMWLGSTQTFAAAPPSTEFDWSVTTGPGNGGDAGEYTPAPILTDQSVNSGFAFLTAHAAIKGSLPLAIKVTGPDFGRDGHQDFRLLQHQICICRSRSRRHSPNPALVNQVRQTVRFPNRRSSVISTTIPTPART